MWRLSCAVALLWHDLPGIRSLSLDDLPANVKEVEYAVRGEMDQIAQGLAEQLKKENHGLPFDEIVPCNIGNPQVLGQPPITFHRQMLSLLTNPELQTKNLYAKDVHDRARNFSEATRFGAYSHSQGIPLLRQQVASFIQKRDGAKVGVVDAESVYLTDGASPGVKTSLGLLISGASDGILIPVPQYPLYSAAITNYGGTAVGYYLDEAKGWSVSTEEIQKAIDRFKVDHPNGRLKAFVAINPGNPTGNVMSRKEMEDIVRLCDKHKLVLLADEVYQENIWSDRQWESFRKVAGEMKSKVEMISFHSISKGYYGECGLRGGYMQIEHIDPKVAEQMYKMVSVSLCSNTLGQAMTASVMNPPIKGDASFESFEGERIKILESLQRKSVLLAKRLNGLPGMSCQPITGAMYAFPRIELSKAAIAAADEAGKKADLFYCIALLNATGIVVVPGSGFKQEPGTWHFRITILPSEDKLPALLDRLEKFHRDFITKYGNSEL
mmetsp:Transcript_13768/g.48612  ORF Transcript_13768/g.48612 Transcript_13768/m.48612 type:complete len:496 (+) Transcript_13768:285-1772(+)